MNENECWYELEAPGETLENLPLLLFTFAFNWKIKIIPGRFLGILVPSFYAKCQRWEMSATTKI